MDEFSFSRAMKSALETLPRLWEYKQVQLWKTVWMFVRKLKSELPYNLAIPLLEIYPDKTTIQKDTCTCIFVTTLFVRSKTQKKT